MSEKTKNRIFWSIFSILILGSVFATYIRIFVLKDYMLVMEVSCDPDVESCFVYSPEELCEGSEDYNCVENTEPEYYKIINKKAASVAVCNPDNLEDGEECLELSCGKGESDCYYEYNE